MVVRQLIALPSQSQLIDRLQHHIYLSSSLILLSGEQGSGKTTLLEQLTNKLARNTQEAFIQLSGQLADAQVRTQILLQLYENALFDAEDSLFSSVSLLQEKQHSDLPRLIILDNAQHLSSTLLAELTELLEQKALWGDNEINVLLLVDEANSRQVFAAANQIYACLEFKIEPLSKEESTRLLEHVFQQSDYQHQIQHQNAVSKQLTACQGVPKKIIALAEEIMSEEVATGELSWLKTRLPAILLMLLLLLIAAGLGSYLYPIFIKSDKPFIAVESVPQQQEIVVSQSAALPTIVKEEVGEQLKPATVEALAGSWKERLADIDENKLQVGVKDADTKENGPKVVFIEEVPLKVVPKLTENITAAVNTEEQDKSIEREINSTTSMVEEVESKVPQSNELESKAETVATTKEIKPVLKKEGNGLFTPKADLLSISPIHYTLQLSAMATNVSLQRFVREHGLPNKNLHIYQTIHNNKPWYVVIFGEYESWGAAKRASAALPGSLANLDSWIKKYQLVHQDLQLNND